VLFLHRKETLVPSDWSQLHSHGGHSLTFLEDETIERLLNSTTPRGVTSGARGTQFLRRLYTEGVLKIPTTTQQPGLGNWAKATRNFQKRFESPKLFLSLGKTTSYNRLVLARFRYRHYCFSVIIRQPFGGHAAALVLLSKSSVGT